MFNCTHVCLATCQGNRTKGHGDLGKFWTVAIIMLLRSQRLHLRYGYIWMNWNVRYWWLYHGITRFRLFSFFRSTHLSAGLSAGFVELSQDELRLEYYNGRASGDLQTYVSTH